MRSSKQQDTCPSRQELNKWRFEIISCCFRVGLSSFVVFFRACRDQPRGVFLLLGTIVLLTASASPASSVQPAGCDLTGTSWQLRSIQSMDDTHPTITLEQPERYTLHFHNNNLVSLRLDCNRGTGSWQATSSASGSSGQLTFGPIAMTRMFCPPPSLDNRVARDLSFIRSYILRDGNLYLSLMADGGIYEWQPNSYQP